VPRHGRLADTVAQTVDRRVVVSPAQAGNLGIAVRGLSGRGANPEAFYACLCYAALRPVRGLHAPRNPGRTDAWRTAAASL
jgi:hypothetical protein